MHVQFAKLHRLTVQGMMAVVLSTSVASAQSAWGPIEGDVDGGGASVDAAPRALIGANCTTPVQSRFRTESSGLQTDSTSFSTVPGAVLQVIVPAGTTRCVKAVFTGEAGCRGPAGDAFCYIRAIADGAVMNPNGGSEQVFSSNDPSAESHAYTWINRLGPGTYNIAVQGRVENSATDFFLDDWTFEVETLR